MSGFEARMELLAKNVQRNVNGLVKKVAKDILEEVVESTPIDTGKARSNWRVALGRETDGYIDSFAPGKKGSTTAEVNAVTIESGHRIIDARIQGIDIHIGNSAPYIGELNDGYSAQAPADYVEESIRNAVMTISQVEILSDNLTP